MFGLNISSFGSVVRERKAVDPLSILLEECGYLIFEIDPSRQRQRHHDDMMIIHEDEPASAMWLYRRADDGVIVVRPWAADLAYEHLKRRLADKTRHEIRLVKGRHLKSRKAEDTWLSWLSKASKREAMALGYK